ncbi:MULTISPECIES: DUF1345 domain-containing protein [Nitrospirillum]|uniref:Putative membrane protein n=1 Tax=Nitrospirillum amazonense TaxID=28077 RepID=A0A560FHI1_9PROT|nr:DUF1345 domain-containing protein [Nitrospirillum amazonense]MEC4590505.1 DUF1345 domain-containing protein [Nitrospirillum amazonense]TWB21059.1 putative membrane protein [Nitrospirillum amazonense]
MAVFNPLQPFRHHPSLYIGLAFSVAVGLAASRATAPVSAVLIGWCAGIILYIALVLIHFGRANLDSIRARARELESGKWVILLVTSTAALASLAAIVMEVADAKGTAHVAGSAALGATTVFCSWSFVHVIFAQHYAHSYWLEGKGIDFPGCKQPDYWEFLYFAFTIGMTAQVSDVTTQGPAIRRSVLAHSLLSFIFNTAILALGINLGAGLLGN